MPTITPAGTVINPGRRLFLFDLGQVGRAGPLGVAGRPVQGRVRSGFEDDLLAVLLFVLEDVEAALGL
ncbi:hypothetical protein AB0M36_25485, partial [Actinoplanes sp. NPDC051346]|uniref:hypothetical protein n=1 Tax=Actinoplanes sp. NPDC051346 TaxID=3155048 RepID=UPI00343D5F73